MDPELHVWGFSEEVCPHIKAFGFNELQFIGKLRQDHGKVIKAVLFDVWEKLPQGAGSSLSGDWTRKRMCIS